MATPLLPGACAAGAGARAIGASSLRCCVKTKTEAARASAAATATPTLRPLLFFARTSRADAYQAYVAGTQALNRFDGPTAKKHLEQAIRLDTAFALAHYKWAIAALYDEKAGAARQAQLKVAEMNKLA